MKRRLAALLAAAVLCLSLGSSARADYRVNWYQGQNPPSAWMMQMARYERQQLGEFMADAFGLNANGSFNNILTVSSALAPNGCCYTGLVLSAPGSGLGVTITENTNQYGAVYGYHGNDPSGWNNGGIAALTSDAGILGQVGLFDSAATSLGDAAVLGTVNITGLSAGASSGQSLPYLIECAIVGVNATGYNSKTVTLVSGTGVVSTATEPMTYASVPTCQAKAGTSSASPTVPSVDNAYVAIGSVIIPYGTTNVTGGMISQTNYPAWPGFASLSPSLGPTAGLITNPAGLALQGGLKLGVDSSTSASIVFGSTGTETMTAATTGSAAAFAMNSTGGTSGDLLDVQKGGTTEAAVHNNGDFGINGSILISHNLEQVTGNQFATRHALTSGTYTFTYGTAFTSTPVCTATSEGTTGTLHVTPSTTSCVVTSSSGTDTSTVDIVVVGNPF